MRRQLKIFAVMLTACVILAVTFGGCFLFGSTPYDPNMIELDAPQSVYFSDGNFTLYWDEVEHAKSYEVKHNNSTVNVGKATSKQILELTEGKNTFKVRAMGDDVTYNTSRWSEEVEYYYSTSIEDKTIYEVVRDKIIADGKADRKEFIKIVGISFANNDRLSLVGANIIFETVWNDNGVQKNIGMEYYVADCADIEEVLDNFADGRLVGTSTYKTVNYDSAEYLVKSKDYVGYMNTLKGQGYTISVVDSVVREGKASGKQFMFEIVGTFKAQLGDDVKYFSALYKVLTAMNSSNPRDNYESLVGYPADRTLTEISLVKHDAEGTLSYIEEWVARQNR